MVNFGFASQFRKFTSFSELTINHSIALSQNRVAAFYHLYLYS
ncbi:hypothetical protein SAMN05421856_10163 [Chryseobacterium taichungense]|uniref:Uncharacterized protein n=1 Tax=Chryseobacterium taichungense TaxID=295069 RepID=A0A1H7VKQ6_9FLAO|nr:hypothetical protein SAMN05421856_10163 [Chryseobacterium taichungense]